MTTIWKLQDAKARFSQVVKDAQIIGPQFVSRRGRKTAVVLSVEDYEKLTSDTPSFKDFLLTCPKISDDFGI